MIFYRCILSFWNAFPIYQIHDSLIVYFTISYVFDFFFRTIDTYGKKKYDLSEFFFLCINSDYINKKDFFVLRPSINFQSANHKTQIYLRGTLTLLSAVQLNFSDSVYRVMVSVTWKQLVFALS